MLLIDAGHLMSEIQLNDQSGVAQAEVRAEQASDMQQAVLGPGAQLAVHRQAKGMTIEQVANQLNLAPRQIQALEADNYAALPGVVIARGFVRAYAKLLKVDPAPLVSLMQGETAPMESIQLKRALSGSFSESRLPPTVRNGLLSKWAIAAALAVLIVVGGFAAHWFGFVPGFSESISENVEKGATFLSSTPDSASSDRVTAIPDNASAPVANSQDTSTANKVTKDEITAPITATVPTTGLVTKDASAAPSAPVSALNAAPAIPVSPVTPPNIPAPFSSVAPPVTQPAPATLSSPPSAAKAANQDNTAVVTKNMLTIKAREESWIEVKDASDRILISRLMAAGSTETLSIAKPVSLTVGNVTGVDVTLRGNSVDLKSAAKNNVVRIDLK
jgi:cytoskeleton protein RodZ